MSGLLKGPKFSSRTQTYIENAVPLIKFARASDAVKKVVLGPIKPIRGKTTGVTIEETPTSVLVKVFQNNSYQLLYFIGDKAEIITELNQLLDM